MDAAQKNGGHSRQVQYKALSRPGKIGSLELPHRILMGSMHMGLEGREGTLDMLTEFYRERAVGQAALIITGGAAVVKEGGADNMYVMTEDADVTALGQLPPAVHEAGGKIALQLFHSGRYAISDEIGMQPVAPSPIPSRLTRETPKEMTVEDIETTILRYAEAAQKAQSVGYDAVEIMGSEGYLLNQFLSPVTNHRNDKYGGSLQNRMRFSLEVMEAIRHRVGGDYPVIFRMSGLDCMPGSTTEEETLAFAKALEASGVDALNIGIGWHEARVPTVQQVVPRAGFAVVARAIRREVGIPVIGANRLNVPEVADELVASGYLDFVAPARPWLADSRLAAKTLEGDREAINVCIACNQSCLDHTLVRPHKAVSCLVNPRAGQEVLWPKVVAPKQKSVAVVGAGPAGLQAALTAAERGHGVVLYERQSEIGGQFRMAGKIPGKYEFYETIRYYSEQLQRLNVTVKLETSPSVDELSRYDHVIMAHGVKPRLPEIPGTSLPNVVSYPQLLTGEVSPAETVAIVGAGGIGCDVATYLAEGSLVPSQVSAFFKDHALQSPPAVPRKITVLARSGHYGKGIGSSTRWVVKQEMQRLGIDVILNFEFKEITQHGVVGYTDAGEVLVPAAQVVLCTGQEPEEFPLRQLQERTNVHLVGGARDSQGINAARAIREAFETAYQLS
ncbi:FAD-dependent oxidoreductase [Alicyclobacillus sp. SO9]|uniref:FAD-dependent oxidoreductase n=1 Tax=Alicyclobacillus sp. SO9 TaxID=2665646 RepID=UPI0018E882A7|nr:NADPH-dependent 2,4-dienoyl-CoA reductase [Alicyclobacillus sp. SO9]QQE79858.1 FAD-dependent oxidoreductase [Alicyclobacillus sp. SO9]